jgi:cytidylate kinase
MARRFAATGLSLAERSMAIVTLSHQHGSRGEAVAAEVARQMSFSLVTPDNVDRIIQERYHLDYSLTGQINRTPREGDTGKVFASLIAAILTDMAVRDDLVLQECGGEFIFRAFPNALHVRIVAARETRIRNVMQDAGVSFEQALMQLEERERRQERFLRSSFRRAREAADRYDLVLNGGSLEVAQIVEIIVFAAQKKDLTAYGVVSSETTEHARLRNQIRLVRAVTKLALETNQTSLTQFAHPSELVFSRLLDFYGIRWQYEPRTFPLKYDETGNIVEAFSPDFYLPDSNMYVELTTMKQSLVTKKNRKVKRLRELYPDINIRLLYQKDFEDLIFKYTAGEQAEK